MTDSTPPIVRGADVAALTCEPLNMRLRAEAAEWDEGDVIPALLIEAAEAIEELATAVAITGARIRSALRAVEVVE